ncbi:MAG: AIPR family protein [Hydrotalea sp.]|nr:AIPR family protein [Hydrotalea sp.]
MTKMLNDILKARLQKIISENANNFPALPRKKLEERQMSYAFVIYSVQKILDLSTQEAMRCITDGGGDKGIDAIYVDEESESVHFFSNKFHQNATEKMFPENDLTLLNNSIRIIMRQESPAAFCKLFNQANALLKEKINEISALIGKSHDIFVNIYTVVNSNRDDVIKDDWRSLNYTNYQYCPYGLPTLMSEEDESLPITYSINSDDEKLYKKEISNPDMQAYFLSLPAIELAKLYEQEKEKMLANNIRYYLGKTKINKKIKQAIEKDDNKSLFWACNNGICIICKIVSSTPDSNHKNKIKLVNPKIINGGQTTNAIYEEYKNNPEKLKGISVPVRIYQTSDDDIIAKITEGLNSQNNIFSRDVKSYNPIQKQVVEFFKQKNINLSVKRKEKFDNDNTTISNEVVFQSYIALYEGRPSEAKSSKSKIFENDFDGVFDGSKLNIHLEFYRSYELYKIVEDKESQLKKQSTNNFIQHADFALIYSMGRIDPAVKDATIEFKNIQDLYNKSLKIIKNIVKEQKKKLKGNYSHNNLFKSNEIKNLIDKKIK